VVQDFDDYGVILRENTEAIKLRPKEGENSLFEVKTEYSIWRPFMEHWSIFINEAAYGLSRQHIQT